MTRRGGSDRSRGATIAVYGRKPVLEVLTDPAVEVERVLVARSARGDAVEDILRAAQARGTPLRRAGAHDVTRLSGNGRQDQGVVAEVRARGLAELEDWLPGAPGTATVLLLDGVTTPANVGMILRSAVAAGLDGVVVPRAGCAGIGPLVVKASAGTAFAAPVLRAGTAADAADALVLAGFRLLGLRPDGATPIWDVELRGRTALVLGGESAGVSPAVSRQVGEWVAIPMPGGTESLNVAVAAGIAAYEVVRRGRTMRG